jgi:hypothetical protein
VLKATYSRGKKQLDIEATSSDAPDAILTVYDISNGSNTSLGALTYNSRKGKYAGGFKLPAAPAQIEVRSSNGGSDTSLVTAK